ncbi:MULTISPECIES: IS3 family transposase [Chromobacterium]|uniref:IS3 family transposase n=1 Tax=Chromobacterium TaxID=535 RepID=UPI0018C069FA|nr:transposase [Chromobacterium sp. Rain0013]
MSRKGGAIHNAALRVRLRELADRRRRFGSPRLHSLLRREGWPNHKRVVRIYKEEGLLLRLRRRKKRPSHLWVVQPMPEGQDRSPRRSISFRIPCGMVVASGP